MNLRPLDDLVIVRRAKPDEKSEGGILLTNEGRVSIFADVVAAGPKATTTAGERVVLAGWAGKQVRFNGEDLLCVKDKDVVAVVQ